MIIGACLLRPALSGSQDKGARCQARGAEFYPQDPHGGRSDLSTHIGTHMWVHACMYTHQHMQISKLNKESQRPAGESPPCGGRLREPGTLNVLLLLLFLKKYTSTIL